MSDLPKTVIKLAAELLKHQSKNILGDGFMNTLGQSFADFVGDTTIEKVNAFLTAGENAKKLLAAFNDADEAFRKEGTDILRQMIASKRLAELESLEKLASVLPQTLDSDGLLNALHQRFEADWPNLSAEVHTSAAYLYRTCLERALAARCNQIIPSIFTKVERIEANTEKLLDELRGIRDSVGVSVSVPIPRQLDAPPADFVGRDAEEAELLTVVEKRQARILAIFGMGGVGKTTLALKLADTLQDRYPDAQFYLDLKGTSKTALTSSQVMAHVVRSYDPKFVAQDEAELKGRYRSLLKEKRALLFLDNATGEEQFDSLLPPPDCLLLVTSRKHFTVPGMYDIRLDTLPAKESKALLLKIAIRIGDDADEIAKLCGYLPYALRVAGSMLAARKDLLPKHYIQRLQEAKSRLPLINAPLSLSHDSLSADLQRYWQMLAVFPTTFERRAAGAVWSLENEVAHNLLSELVSYSLVEYTPVTDRYCLHDLARVFADALLADSERERGCQQYSHYYSEVLYEANELHEQGGEQVMQDLVLLDLEWMNIQIGQEWAAHHIDTNDIAAQLCRNYLDFGYSYLDRYQRLLDRDQWFDAALKAAQQTNDRKGEAIILNMKSVMQLGLGNAKLAQSIAEKSLALARDIGDPSLELRALIYLSSAEEKAGHVFVANTHAKEAVRIAKETKDDQGFVFAVSQSAKVFLRLGVKSLETFERILSLTQNLGDQRAEMEALDNLAEAHSQLKQYEQAIGYLEQRLIICEAMGDQLAKVDTLIHSASIYHSWYKPDHAMKIYQEAHSIARRHKFMKAECRSLNGVGSSHVDLGMPDRAVDYFRQGLELAREYGYRDLEGSLLFNLGAAHKKLDDHHQAGEWYELAANVFRDLGNLLRQGWALCELAECQIKLGEAQQGIDILGRIKLLSVYVVDLRLQAEVLLNFGYAYEVLGEPNQVIQFCNQALELARKIGDRQQQSEALQKISRAKYNLRDLRQAIAYLEESIEIDRQLGKLSVVISSLKVIATLYENLGELNKALENYQRAYKFAVEKGDRRLQGLILKNGARLLYAGSDLSKAIATAKDALKLLEDVDEGEADGVRQLLAQWEAKTDAP